MRLQTLFESPPASVEDSKGDRVKGKSCRPVKICRKLQRHRFVSEYFLLLCTESKIFFSILLRRLKKFLLENNDIDTSVQKGGILGFPECLGHTGVITQILRDARESREGLVKNLYSKYGWIS